MKKEPTIAIVDYDVGNFYSVLKALQKFTNNVSIVDDSNCIAAADAIVLPGVGAFQEGIAGLQKKGLYDSVKTFAESGKPILGICLGAQLLLTTGEEFGMHKGLNLIDGNVIAFPDLDGTKIPHIGWNTISLYDGGYQKGLIFSAGFEGSSMYFVHSYILVPDKKENLFATTTYGGHEFCSIVRSGNIYGCQFHPEKSGERGLKILKDFVDLSAE